MMKTFDVQSVGVKRPPAAVFGFIADPANLPRWTNAFSRADATSADLVTPNGAVPIKLDTIANEVACRHLERERKRGQVEAMRLTFDGFATDLESGLSDIQDHGLTPIEEALAVEDVKVGCTLAMLTCPSRPVRIA
jgi:hypothetical protein